MGLTRLAITRPIFIFMLMVGAILMGTLSYRSMRVELNPDVQYGVITVTTAYPGAGPDEINTLVSKHVEEAVSGISGLREVTSTSQEGISTVVAQFEVGTDMDEALNEARSKVDRVVGDLPDAATKPTITKLDSSSDPVLTMVLRSEKLNNQQLRDLADDKLKDRFARIAGVSAVSVSGGDVREIQVQVKRDKLLTYGLGIVDVQRALLGASLNVPSGRVVTGNQEFSVRVLGEFKTVDDVRDSVLQIRDPKTQFGKARLVRLSEIAEVTDATQERRSYSRLNGSDAVVMTVQKAKEGSAIQIARAAEDVRKGLETEYGLEIITTFNQATQIQESLSDLNFALFFGIALVTLIVFVFLHNLRGTIIVGIAIPVSIFATFIVLDLLGFTINNMSMLALSLAIGVLVDDAIVVLENIYRHLRMGEDPRDAAINGRSEIGLAAIAITMADVVIFIPIAFMGGVVGQFFRPLGIAFAVATLFSLFVSFTVTPMLASRWYRKGEDMEHPTGAFARWFERRFSALEHFYRRSLEWALRHRWFVFISGFVVLISVFIAIAGSFAPSAQGAMQTGIGPLMAAVLLGIAVFGLQYWGNALTAPTRRWVWLAGTVGLAVLFFALPQMAAMAPPVKVLLALVAYWPVSGVFALVANLAAPKAQSRRILQGLGFGLVFPVAALAGFAYGQWKNEAAFKFQFFPASDGGRVAISAQLAPGASLDETLRVVERIEGVASKHPDVKYVRSTVGSRGGGGWSGPGSLGSNYGQVDVTLNDRAALLDRLMFWKEHEGSLRTRSDTSIVADLQQEIGRIPGAELTISASGGVGFGAPIQMSFGSEDREQLLRTVSAIRLKLDQGAIEGVISPDISSKPGKPEVRAVPNTDRLADAGLSTADVANSMRMLYEGNDDAKFRSDGKEYDIRVMMDIGDRNDLSQVGEVPVSFVQGNPIFLSQVADLERGTGVDKIERRNREEEVRLTAELLPGYAAGSVQTQIDNWLKNENLVPPNVRIKPLGQAEVQARESIFLFGALAIGLVLVYMLLASLYDNLLYPFIIQLAQPQAMVGAILALVLTDKALNIVGFVGIITLVGLVGKNAILLVDYTNTLRGRGKDRHDALVEAGPTRLRPILMTTLALILGMLPVALAIGRGSEFRETIGITIIGGILLSTVLTLLVIPCSYTIFDDLALKLSKGRHRNEAEPEPEGAPA
ncbi:MAG: efflux RND transporter permease subunit [Fimbriimonadaceae bacterium]|nr:efflux RND transporter permease subunit [Chthonomonadaceae bacterium]MCO5296028.1 efflux RND transporter permease subunit [Fimbriimonadaceae bacterium]